MENFLVNYLLPIFGSFFAFLALMLTRKILAWIQLKLNISMDDQFNKNLDRTVSEAVWAAEEKAASSLKLGLPKWTGNMKYKWAIDIICNRFPQLSREEADSKIDSMLGKTYGLGSSKETGKNITVSTCTTSDLKLADTVEKELSKP